MFRASLGELKQQIYSVLEEKKTASVKEVCDALHNSRKYTTIMTVMNRMWGKGELRREKIGACFIYQINPQEKKKAFPLLAQIKQKLFQGKTKAFVSYLLEVDEEISKEDLEEIKQIIDAMGRKNLK